MPAFTKFFLIPALIFIGVLLTCCSSYSNSGNSPKKLAERLNDKETLDFLSHSEEIYVYGTRPNKETFFQLVTDPKQLTAEQARKFKSLLLSDSSYLFDRTKKCLFIPQAAFKFVKDGKESLVLFSMSCNQLRFMLQGRHVTLDYDPVQDQFAELFDEMLPPPANDK